MDESAASETLSISGRNVPVHLSFVGKEELNRGDQRTADAQDRGGKGEAGEMRDADEDLRLGCMIAAAIFMNAEGTHGDARRAAEEFFQWVIALREKEPTDENV